MSIQKGQVCTETFSMDYFSFGNGERTCVILPGLSIQSVMGAAEAVEAEYQVFSRDFTVYLFDRRRDLPPVYRVEDMAEDTAEAMRTLGLKDIYLFGASQGGMIALVIAERYPDLVRRMVLGSTSARVGKDRFRTLENWIRLAREKDGPGLCLDFGREIYPPAVFDQYRAALLEAGKGVTDAEMDRFVILAEGIRGFQAVETLDQIACPVLAIGVFEDRVLDSDATMEIAEKLDRRADFRLYMYIGYGHAAFDTAPDYRDRVHRFFMEDGEGPAASEHSGQ